MTKKIKPVEKVRSIIDEIAEIDSEMKELKNQREDLDTLLKKYVETKGLGDDMDALIIGDSYELEVGVAGSKRLITNLPKVRKILGDKAFMGIATVKLKDIDQYLTEEQQEEVITTERTQTRVYKYKKSEPKSNLKKKKAKAR